MSRSITGLSHCHRLSSDNTEKPEASSVPTCECKLFTMSKLCWVQHSLQAHWLLQHGGGSCVCMCVCAGYVAAQGQTEKSLTLKENVFSQMSQRPLKASLKILHPRYWSLYFVLACSSIIVILWTEPAVPLLLHQGPSRMVYDSSLNSRSTAERRGRWEKRWASVMWFSTFFRWVSSGASWGAPLWSFVSSMGMLTEPCSSVLSAMLKRLQQKDTNVSF